MWKEEENFPIGIIGVETTEILILSADQVLQSETVTHHPENVEFSFRESHGRDLDTVPLMNDVKTPFDALASAVLVIQIE